MRGKGAAALAFLAFLVAASGTAKAVTHERQNTAPYTDVLNLLESSGYINFTGFNTFGNSFEATVVRHGKRMLLLIDPRRHRIIYMP